MGAAAVDVLVTGVEERQGLAVVRSLGRRGLRVAACASSDDAIGFCSRYATVCATYPSPDAGTRDFAQQIAAVAKEHSAAVIMPSVESTVIALDAHRELFDQRVALAMPGSAVLEMALDKRRTYQACERLDIPVPRSCYPANIEDGLAFANEVGYPVVLKPRAQSIYHASGVDFGFKVRYARDLAELQAQLEKFSEHAAFPILQEYCSGDGVAHSFIVVNGEVRGLYQHRRDREYPLTGGVASVIRSEPIDPVLRDWTHALAAEASWDGVAQVEYRHDLSTVRRALIEVNGRFWAPLSGAIQLGLDYPYAYYRYIRDGDEDVLPENYEFDRRFRYLRGDLFALESYLRGDTVEGLRKLPGRAGAVWHVLRDFGPGASGDVWWWADMRPGLREARLLLSRYFGRVLRKLGIGGRGG